ncbi:unnamed protein product [Moneuplotes crassus]|uniref:Uncharacterized protein n=1 Tax=Euplotes crassus TaxID=5936 RepID=A0AAD1XG61_EUPCR|nr:unnamed protein product [Moneuplotes crassus]
MEENFLPNESLEKLADHAHALSDFEQNFDKNSLDANQFSDPGSPFENILIEEEDPEAKIREKHKAEFIGIIEKIKNGFESTPGLDENRKKVGLEVFQKIFEMIKNFEYSSWFLIEQQSSTVLSTINTEMRSKLKEFNVESVCQQIEQYVYDNIKKKIYSDSTGLDQKSIYNYLKNIDEHYQKCTPSFLSSCFEELEFYKMPHKEEKVKYCEEAWKRYGPKEIQAITNNFNSNCVYNTECGFDLSLTSLNPKIAGVPLGAFNNDIIDILYLCIKEQEIKDYYGLS